MFGNRPTIALLIVALAAVGGCSKSDDLPAASAAAPTAVADKPVSPASASVPAASRESAKACDLVTSAEMSAILGSNVVGTESNHKSSGKTTCTYKPAEGISPYVEFSVEWGEGESAMQAMGAAAHAEPGITNPYAGIGDQAAAVGTALMIRTGADLVTITFSGVDGAPQKAKKIFDTAKARM